MPLDPALPATLGDADATRALSTLGGAVAVAFSATRSGLSMVVRDTGAGLSPGPGRSACPATVRRTVAGTRASDGRMTARGSVKYQPTGPVAPAIATSFVCTCASRRRPVCA